jgi:outer membrane lipoprotein-sorting protein
MRILLCLIILLVAPTSQAVELPEKAQKLVSKAEQFLNSTKTMQAKFTQITPQTGGGNVASGKMYMKRPGRIRWEYNSPQKIMILLRGNNVTFHDIDLDQVSYGSIDNVLGSLLAQEDIKFNSDTLMVTEVREDDAGFHITLRQRTGEEKEDGTREGREQLILTFTEKPFLSLVRLKIYEPNGRINTVQFSNIKYNKEIDENLFVFKDPNFFNRKRRN